MTTTRPASASATTSTRSTHPTTQRTPSTKCQKKAARAADFGGPARSSRPAPLTPKEPTDHAAIRPSSTAWQATTETPASRATGASARHRSFACGHRG
ncbi:hypothetical protein G6F35_014448 [Rhizopus arrhizus]|nr:hypothetical protein G6F35_014448 [Rhizopus arrhizus]